MFIIGDEKISGDKSGFTLLEMLVAVSIFAIVMTITLSAFLNITDIQAKAESFRRVNDNLNFAMEAMMREIREGYDYVDGGDGSISFTSVDGKSISYNKEEETKGVGYIKRAEDGASSRITSESIDIKTLTFDIRGVGTNDAEQPIVIINLSGESGKKEKIKSSLYLQTTVSQRKLDTGYEY